MKLKTYFLLSSIVLVCLFAFKIKSGNAPANLKSPPLDTAIKVTVQLEEIPGAGTYCGVVLIRGNYKFKVIHSNGYLNKSADDHIKIQFTCPKETMVDMIPNKNYSFNIVALNEFKIGPGKVVNQVMEDGLPVYTILK